MSERAGGFDRRSFLVAGALAVPVLAGCAGGGRRFGWKPDEQRRLDEARPDFEVVVRGAADAAVLRRRAREVPDEVDLTRVARRMEAAMRQAGGVGIAGPQVGLGLRVAMLLLDYKTETPRPLFVINPRIVERSDETIEGYEGCLSVPGVGGLVRRNRWLRLRYRALSGELAAAEAEGPNAVLWQHELDHLDGELYTDRLLGELLPMDEVRRRREALERPAVEGVSRAGPAEPLEGLLFAVG